MVTAFWWVSVLWDGEPWLAACGATGALFDANQNEEGPHWAGLLRVIFLKNLSYAQARQRLALLFARLLLLPASTPLRAQSAERFMERVAKECIGELEQIAAHMASAA